MELQNKPKILAATYNPVSQTKMFTVMVDIPYVLLPELLQCKELSISYKNIEDITLQEVLDNPFVPIWTKQQKGMSGGELSEKQKDYANRRWLKVLTGHRTEVPDYPYNSGIQFYYGGILNCEVHKENANRLLAPFAYTTCIISGTEWENFFEKFCPKYSLFYEQIPMSFKSKKELIAFVNKVEANEFKNQYDNLSESEWYEINKSTAQPEFQIITEMLYDLYKEADWQESKYHIPFYKEIEEKYYYDACFDFYENKSKITPSIDTYYDARSYSNVGDLEPKIWYDYAMKISASLCSNLSYNTQDNEDTLEKHFENVDMLIKNNHLEWFNYQAVTMDNSECQVFTKTYLVSTCPENTNGALIKSKGTVTKYKDYYLVTKYGWCQNLHGFISNRYLIENF